MTSTRILSFSTQSLHHDSGHCASCKKRFPQAIQQFSFGRPVLFNSLIQVFSYQRKVCFRYIISKVHLGYSELWSRVPAHHLNKLYLVQEMPNQSLLTLYFLPYIYSNGHPQIQTVVFHYRSSRHYYLLVKPSPIFFHFFECSVLLPVFNCLG